MQVLRTAVLAAIALTVVAPEAGAAARADLRVTKLSEPPAGLQAGAALAVTDTVRNAGRRKAKKTVVVYWLSTDRRKNAGDVRVGRRSVKALRARRSARGRATLELPASLPAGAYHLIACADGTAKVRERSERNNCRASGRRVTVTAPGLPGVPGLPAPAGTPAPSTPSPEPTPSPAPGSPSGPLSVTHTLDTSRSVTQRIQPVGGSIETTAADGTKYTLTVPNKALVSGIDITLTPVTAVNGSPLGGLVGAVEILPHGLELLEPATLLIEPGGSAGPVEGQTAFMSHEEGEDFHLYPLEMGEPLKLSLQHFSTPGVAQATDAERQVVLGASPERQRARYAQMMAELLRETRAAQIAGQGEGLPVTEMAAILAAFYRDVVAPLVHQAKTDDTVATEATAELLGWAKQIDRHSLQELDAVKAYRDAVWPNLELIIANAIDKGYTRCVTHHDLDFIARLVGLARAAALLGIPLGAEALDKAERCGTFRLDVDSRFTLTWGFNAPDGRTGQTTGAWRVQTPPDGIEIPMSGLTMTGSLRYTEFSYAQTMTYPCGQDKPHLRYETVGTATVPDDEVWVLLDMDLNPREPGTPPPADRDIRVLLLQYEGLQEKYRETNPVWCGETQTPDRDYTAEQWRGYFNSYHLSSGNPYFDDWTMGAGDVTAYYDFNGSNVNHGTTASTHLTLRHVPAT